MKQARRRMAITTCPFSHVEAKKSDWKSEQWWIKVENRWCMGKELLESRRQNTATWVAKIICDVLQHKGMTVVHNELLHILWRSGRTKLGSKHKEMMRKKVLIVPTWSAHVLVLLRLYLLMPLMQVNKKLNNGSKDI